MPNVHRSNKSVAVSKITQGLPIHYCFFPAFSLKKIATSRNQYRYLAASTGERVAIDGADFSSDTADSSGEAIFFR